MENGNHYSEYYFDYKLQQVGVDGGSSNADVKAPKLYFERDYRKKNVPWSLSIVPHEWVGKFREYSDMVSAANQQGGKRVWPESLPYDTVHVVLSVGKVDYSPLLSSESEEYKLAAVDKTMTFKDFYAENCNVVIDSASTEKSGAGVVEMLRNGEMVARFAFVVNCIKRKRITYEIGRAVNKATGQKVLTFAFACKDKPQGLKVAVLSDKGRLPCMRDDVEKNSLCTFALDFSQDASKVKRSVKISLKGKKGVYIGQISVDSVSTALENNQCFSFAFSEEWMNYYYVLECVHNSTVQIKKDDSRIMPVAEHSCPYCHNVISASRGHDGRYQKGGISCIPLKGADDKDIQTDLLPAVFENRGAPVKKCLYCAEDLIVDERQGNIPRFRGEFLRLLPPDFLGHQDFKIAFAGSARAGKTTYISRFFAIDGTGERISMKMEKTAMGLREFGVELKPTRMERIEASPRREGDTGAFKYVAQTYSWEESEPQYIERRISLKPPHYPVETREADYTKYPFIAEVNGKAYVSFYDIAGEDAQRKTTVGSLDTMKSKPIGIFCIVNGERDAEGNRKVMDMLELGGLSEDCPVAIIVTKMDILRKEFEPSCHCLRSDYFEKIRSYEGSDIEREIDFISEEIHSYLQAKGLNAELRGFKNIKYFGVSAFNFGESIHGENEDVNARGNVFFDCSSKHLELPFLWMMKQFKIIN